MAACKDNSVHLLSADSGKRIGVLKGHNSLPVTAATFKPPLPDFLQYAGHTTGGYNYITSGTDRKMILWNQSFKMLNFIPVENIITSITTAPVVSYRN